MKKGIIGLLSLGLVFAAGTQVLATSDNGFSNFHDMLPFMQEMHPEWSEEELEEMYNACHGENGSRGAGMMQGNTIVD
ncbi:hypothetical protein [Salipaludibacillus aurantiacus]|uniref:FAD/FMN-containing dehydrogenase n=1 Tax=Salipaludibacillus aurantiacus TaxID=1601833 RepID=A0A1H9UBS6_9BACI|nr:hypothetical protein [Salipaludibacillus aurantiacus]SES06915.1 hypothetical protein SAMN05518684_107112 [Salipaludibacillus aurantiacus]